MSAESAHALGGRAFAWSRALMSSDALGRHALDTPPPLPRTCSHTLDIALGVVGISDRIHAPLPPLYDVANDTWATIGYPSDPGSTARNQTFKLCDP